MIFGLFIAGVAWMFTMAVVTYLVFPLSTNAKLKRNIYRWGFLVSDALLFGFFVSCRAAWYELLAAAAILGVITLVQFSGARFCDACGKSFFQEFHLEVCTRCGNRLSGDGRSSKNASNTPQPQSGSPLRGAGPGKVVN